MTGRRIGASAVVSAMTSPHVLTPGFTTPNGRGVLFPRITVAWVLGRDIRRASARRSLRGLTLAEERIPPCRQAARMFGSELPSSFDKAGEKGSAKPNHVDGYQRSGRVRSQIIQAVRILGNWDAEPVP